MEAHIAKTGSSKSHTAQQHATGAPQSIEHEPTGNEAERSHLDQRAQLAALAQDAFQVRHQLLHVQEGLQASKAQTRCVGKARAVAGLEHAQQQGYTTCMFMPCACSCHADQQPTCDTRLSTYWRWAASAALKSRAAAMAERSCPNEASTTSIDRYRIMLFCRQHTEVLVERDTQERQSAAAAWGRLPRPATRNPRAAAPFIRRPAQPMLPPACSPQSGAAAAAPATARCAGWLAGAGGCHPRACGAAAPAGIQCRAAGRAAISSMRPR